MYSSLTVHLTSSPMKIRQKDKNNLLEIKDNFKPNFEHKYVREFYFYWNRSDNMFDLLWVY